MYHHKHSIQCYIDSVNVCCALYCYINIAYFKRYLLSEFLAVCLHRNESKTSIGDHSTLHAAATIDEKKISLFVFVLFHSLRVVRTQAAAVVVVVICCTVEKKVSAKHSTAYVVGLSF